MFRSSRRSPRAGRQRMRSVGWVPEVVVAVVEGSRSEGEDGVGAGHALAHPAALAPQYRQRPDSGRPFPPAHGPPPRLPRPPPASTTPRPAPSRSAPPASRTPPRPPPGAASPRRRRSPRTPPPSPTPTSAGVGRQAQRQLAALRRRQRRRLDLAEPHRTIRACLPALPAILAAVISISSSPALHTRLAQGRSRWPNPCHHMSHTRAPCRT